MSTEFTVVEEATRPGVIVSAQDGWKLYQNHVNSMNLAWQMSQTYLTSCTLNAWEATDYQFRMRYVAAASGVPPNAFTPEVLAAAAAFHGQPPFQPFWNPFGG
ncbi:unnamed protein product, partial [Mesorhabditis spiculigera]